MKSTENEGRKEYILYGVNRFLDVLSFETNGYWYDIYLKGGEYINFVDQDDRILGFICNKEPSREELMKINGKFTEEVMNLKEKYSYREFILNMSLWPAFELIFELVEMSESEFIKIGGRRREVVY